jgi:hypothetical protein
VGIVDEIRETCERLREDKDRLVEAVTDLTGRLADGGAGETFPVMRSHGLDRLRRADHRRRAQRGRQGGPRRSRPLHRRPVHAEDGGGRGPFILGLDDTPMYRHDRAALDRAAATLSAMHDETAIDAPGERRFDGPYPSGLTVRFGG